MLNICVLTKPVYDCNSILWDWERNCLHYKKPTFNHSDLSALQWAYQYRENHNACIRVFAVVDSELNVDLGVLKKYDPDEIVILKNPRLKNDNVNKALILSREIALHPFDIILCGSEGEDTKSGVTPICIAAFLGIPSFSHTYRIESADDTIWAVTRKDMGGIVQTFHVRLPAVIGVIGSVLEHRYLPKSMEPKLGKVVEKMIGPLSLAARKAAQSVTAPQPRIHYGVVPPSSLQAERRLLLVAGLGLDGAEEKSQRIVETASKGHLELVAKKITGWLRGD